VDASETARRLAGGEGEGFPLDGGERADALLAGRALDSVFRPLWSAYATLGDGADLDGRPKLRGDVARRVGVQDWRGCFLHLVAESALLGPRDLRALLELRGRGGELAARQDRRSRLPAALDHIITRVLTTPKGFRQILRRLQGQLCFRCAAHEQAITRRAMRPARRKRRRRAVTGEVWWKR
jgi:hypothetical protein